MQYTSQTQENNVWQCLALVWLMGSVLAWAAAAVWEPRPYADGSALTLMAVLVFGVSLALRLPVLTDTASTPLAADHVVWLAGFTANVNWLGCFALRADQPIDVLPILVLFCAGEWWLLYRVQRSACLPWVRQWLSTARMRITEFFRSQSSSNQSVSLPHPLADVPQSDHVSAFDAAAEDAKVALGGGLLRRSIEGVDEQGNRFACGEVRVEFEPGQVSEAVVLGFVPAFDGPPSIEFETLPDEHSTRDEDLDCQVILVNCTPSGARITLKRKRSGTKASTIVAWYAKMEADAHTVREQAGPRPLPTALP